MAQKEKRVHQCPPIPAEFSRKFTGPALEAGDTADTAARKSREFVRSVSRIRPMPRRTR